MGGGGAKKMKISSRPSGKQFMKDQNQPENVEYVKYFGSLITINEKYICKIKSGVTMTNAAFKTRTTVSPSKIRLQFKDEMCKVLLSEHRFVPKLGSHRRAENYVVMCGGGASSGRPDV
jgi:hypothetical protein